MVDTRSWITSMRERANICAKDLEPWPRYFDLRAHEMEILLSMSGLDMQRSLLEIGCGNGFNSCILSHKAERVVATDLFWQDGRTHSQGMITARKLIADLGVTNCELVACSGEELPFADNTFNAVFSMYTLEHVPDRKRMIRDVSRVLAKDGIFVVMVPAFMERIFHPLAFYGGLAASASKRLFREKVKPAQGSPAGAATSTVDRSSFMARIRKSYPHFPVPEPHGAYRNYFHEIASYRPGAWARLFEENGFMVSASFSTMVVPKAALGVLFGRLAFPIYKRLSFMDRRLGTNPFLKQFGQNICFILRRG